MELRQNNVTKGQQRLMTRVARLYYERHLRQPEIAQQLNISQSKVSRLLGLAEDVGIVRVSIIPPPGDGSELEESLVDHFGLLDAVVVDSPADEQSLVNALGGAAASYLDDILLHHERIGVSSWSAALLVMANSMTPRRKPVAETVTQVLGGIGNPQVQGQATRLTERLAELTGGVPQVLPTFGLVSSGELCRAILGEPSIAPVVEEWGRLTLLLTGIGSVEPSPLLQQSGNAISDDDQERLRQLGGVGDVCLRFFDAEGTEIHSEFEQRVVGIPSQVLRVIPRRIAHFLQQST